jgi:hypothetical protein
MKCENFFEYKDSHLRGDIYLSKWSSFNDPMEGCFSYIVNPNTRISASELRKCIDGYGIHCLSKTFANYLLWSYYADGHKGVCLEFDLDESKLPSEISVVDIVYTKSLPFLDSHKSIPDQAANFLGKKIQHWQQEQEVRILHRSPPSGNIINIGSLSSITFGVQYGKDAPLDIERQHLAQELMEKDPKIKLYQAKIESTDASITRQEFDRYSQNPIPLI